MFLVLKHVFILPIITCVEPNTWEKGDAKYVTVFNMMYMYDLDVGKILRLCVVQYCPSLPTKHAMGMSVI